MTHYVKAERKHFTKSVQDCIIQPLMKQRETGDLCDVTIFVNRQQFRAHRAIVSLWSPYFRSMFTCDMKEKYSGIVDLSKSLVLDDDDVFRLVLDYMYTGSLVLTADNVEDMVRIADFLIMDELKDYCSQFYLEYGNLNLSNCLRVLFLSEDYHLVDVKECAQQMLQSRFHDFIIFRDEILALPPPYFVKLMANPLIVQHTSYSDLKNVVQKWLECDPTSRLLFYEDLAECVSLYLLSIPDEENIYHQSSRNNPSLSYEIKQALSREETDVPHTNLREPLFLQNKFSAPEIHILHKDNGIDDSQDVARRLSDHAFNVLTEEYHQEVLFAVVCNQGLKFLKILMYNIEEQKWYTYPICVSKMLQTIPTRQTVCNLVVHDNYLYMYLCACFPYPTDMLKINILVLDLLTASLILYSFRTVDYYHPCYRTTLTSTRTVPPVMVHCNNSIYVLGNKEGLGHLFMCNLANHQYTSYQIPGARFISLARAVVKSDRNIYIWFRHRTGPSEDYCVNKSVGFVVFDSRNKCFNTWQVRCPDITYDDFCNNYVMSVRDDMIVIYMSGKPALVFDEIRCKWIVSFRRIPPLTLPTGYFSDHFGYQLLTPSTNGIFVLNNSAPYTTSLYEIVDKFPQPLCHTPPPIDHISTFTTGQLPISILRALEPFDRYDVDFAAALHVALQSSDDELNDSNNSSDNSLTPGSENDFEYDDEIYDFEEY